MKQISIFRPGRHVAANGTALAFSEDDLQASIAAYDPAKHEAPIVIGHPKDNAPAYGWIKSLSFADGEMFAEAVQVDADFEEMVQAGRFKKRSASFYLPDSPSNPVPGTYYLRHVGFLGAQPPAVKGLRAVAFAEDDGAVEFADDAAALSIVSRLFRGIRDSLLAKWGQEEVDKALPGFMVEDLEAEARRARETPPDDAPMPAFVEPKPEDGMSITPEQIAELQAKAARVDQLQAENAEYAEREAKHARAARVASIKAELAPLVQQGRVLPRDIDALAEFMSSLDDSAQVAEFGEEAGKTGTSLAFMRRFLTSLPKAVDFTERGAGGGEGSTAANSQELASRARAYKAKLEIEGRQISFTEAVDAVEKNQDKAE